MLAEGVPFSRAPGTGYEYSNFGFALLGRIISNVSGRPYKDYIEQEIMRPLGMASTGYEVAESPSERRAIGYRWENERWLAEPTMAHGAFGAMGGVQTSLNDYARWIAFLLSAWPPRDDPETGPVRRASVRELAEGLNFPQQARRLGSVGGPCTQAVTYGMGLRVGADCDLGFTLAHGGGYPGYGSYMLLLPDQDVGIFAFANGTYAGAGRRRLRRGDGAPWRRPVAAAAGAGERGACGGLSRRRRHVPGGECRGGWRAARHELPDGPLGDGLGA